MSFIGENDGDALPDGCTPLAAQVDPWVDPLHCITIARLRGSGFCVPNNIFPVLHTELLPIYRKILFRLFVKVVWYQQIQPGNFSRHFLQNLATHRQPSSVSSGCSTHVLYQLHSCKSAVNLRQMTGNGASQNTITLKASRV